jgi:hypothetical protein
MPQSRDEERRLAFTPCSRMGLARKVDKREWHSFFFFSAQETKEMRSIEEQKEKERSGNKNG